MVLEDSLQHKTFLNVNLKMEITTTPVHDGIFINSGIYGNRCCLFQSQRNINNMYPFLKNSKIKSSKDYTDDFEIFPLDDESRPPTSSESYVTGTQIERLKQPGSPIQSSSIFLKKELEARNFNESTQTSSDLALPLPKLFPISDNLSLSTSRRN